MRNRVHISLAPMNPKSMFAAGILLNIAIGGSQCYCQNDEKDESEVQNHVVDEQDGGKPMQIFIESLPSTTLHPSD